MCFQLPSGDEAKKNTNLIVDTQRDKKRDRHPTLPFCDELRFCLEDGFLTACLRGRHVVLPVSAGGELLASLSLLVLLLVFFEVLADFAGAFAMAGVALSLHQSSDELSVRPTTSLCKKTKKQLQVYLPVSTVGGLIASKVASGVFSTRSCSTAAC